MLGIILAFTINLNTGLDPTSPILPQLQAEVNLFTQNLQANRHSNDIPTINVNPNLYKTEQPVRNEDVPQTWEAQEPEKNSTN